MMMRISKLLPASAALAGLLSASPASAATLFFDFNAFDSALDFSLTLDSDPTPSVFGRGSFTISDVPVTLDVGSSVSDITFFTVFGDLLGRDGGLEVTALSFGKLSGSQLFTVPALGLTSDPTFLTGDFFLKDDTGFFGVGTLTISTIPEPSVALLSGLGVLALLRRRRNCSWKFNEVQKSAF